MNLRRSQNVSPFATFSGPEIGAQVSIDVVGRWFEQADPESPCPPGFPYANPGIQGTVISFVHKGASASAAELRRVFAEYGQRGEDGPALVMIVDGALAIFHRGGHDKGSLTALDVATGETRWTWNGDGPSYGSPIIATIGGTRQVITITQTKVVGVEFATGAL